MTRAEALQIALLHTLLMGMAVTTDGTISDEGIERQSRVAEAINTSIDLIEEAIKTLRRDPL